MKLLTGLLVLSLIAALVLERGGSVAPAAGGSVVAALAGETSAVGFARADRPRPLRFPRDAGPHPDFQTEWWYYSGNLQAAGGRRFGFQLTFFRRALAPASPRRASPLAARQVYFAHFAVSDAAANRFHASERWSRGAAGLAGARARPYRVWVESWSARSEDGGVRLRAAASPEASVDLLLKPLKPPTPIGEDGLSRKGAAPGNASYYYSQARWATRGTVQADGKRFAVRGTSWLDREWSTSALDPDLAGWDWFGLHLSDGRDLLLYRLRKKRGGVSPFSSGTIIEPDGEPVALPPRQFRIQVRQRWNSPRSGGSYPSLWRVRVPAYGIDLLVTPLQPDQELRLTFTYWEGAVQAIGNGIHGEGYVELTGYAPTETVEK